MAEETGYDTLPTTEAILDRRKQAECRLLFEEMAALVVQMEALGDRMEEIKLELEQFQYMVDAPGLRHENYVFSATEVAGRKTLDKIMLQQNGVAKEVIDMSYKKAESHMRRVFKAI
jgi:hypothetical protein